MNVSSRQQLHKFDLQHKESKENKQTNVYLHPRLDDV